MRIHLEKRLTKRERERQIRWFMKRVTVFPWDDACWIFDAHRERWYYGMYLGEGCHRVAFRLFNPGKNMKGKEVAHTCEISACVNPSHLRLCSHKVNWMDTMDNVKFFGGFTGRRDFLDKKVRMLKEKYIQLVSKQFK